MTPGGEIEGEGGGDSDGEAPAHTICHLLPAPPHTHVPLQQWRLERASHDAAVPCEHPPHHFPSSMPGHLHWAGDVDGGGEVAGDGGGGEVAADGGGENDGDGTALHSQTEAMQA